MATVLREYRCRSRWLEVAIFVVSGIVEIAISVAAQLGGWYTGPVAAYIFLGEVCVALGAWIALQDMWRPRRIMLTDHGILVPRGWLPTYETSVPYSEIVGAWHRETREFRQIGLHFGKQRLVLPPLPTRDEETELLRLLGERLEPFHVSIEARRSQFVNGRWRPQFSVVWLFALTALVAFLVGTWLYFGWKPRPRDVLIACYFGFLVGIPAVVFPFVSYRRWSAFFIGYWAGNAMALLALQWVSSSVARAAPFTGVFEGWYPPTVPVQRWLVSSQGAAPLRTFWYTGAAEVLLSGIVLGLAGVWLGSAVERIVKRRRGTPTPPETNNKPEEILP